MQLPNDNPDDGIVGPVASGFWHAIADEVERIEHGKRSDHPSRKRLSLVSDKTSKARAASAAPAEPKRELAIAPTDATDATDPVDLGDDATGVADETTTDLDDEHSTSAGSPHRLRRFFVSNFRVILPVVVAGGLAVALALTSLSLSSKNSADAARASALQAATTYAVSIGGYNYKNMNQDFGAVLAVSTPSFRKSYSQASGALKTTLVRYHATATAKVVSAGLVSATPTSATALVFLDQNVTNSIQKGATTDRAQVEIDLVLLNGKWLINNVTLL